MDKLPPLKTKIAAWTMITIGVLCGLSAVLSTEYLIHQESINGNLGGFDPFFWILLQPIFHFMGPFIGFAYLLTTQFKNVHLDYIPYLFPIIPSLLLLLSGLLTIRGGKRSYWISFFVSLFNFFSISVVLIVANFIHYTGLSAFFALPIVIFTAILLLFILDIKYYKNNQQ